jgi:nucleotidyltransferase substrate binding protein (TIGR01987 family)
MLSERTRLQIELLGKSLERLREALALDESSIVRDALIQRFEFCFEMAWRSMYRVLLDQDVDVAEQVMAVLREAHKAKLHDDPDGWKATRDNRNLTSHTYNEKTAIQVAAQVRGTAIGLFEKLYARLKALS